jgi:Reverse transcriptase (RNA-dependent DNA polymerase)
MVDANPNYIEKPDHCGHDHGVAPLTSALYGLKSSISCWHERFSEVLVRLGFVQAKAGPHSWTRDTGNGYLHEHVALCVDDLLIASKDPFAIIKDLFDEQQFSCMQRIGFPSLWKLDVMDKQHRSPASAFNLLLPVCEAFTQLCNQVGYKGSSIDLLLNFFDVLFSSHERERFLAWVKELRIQDPNLWKLVILKERNQSPAAAFDLLLPMYEAFLKLCKQLDPKTGLYTLHKASKLGLSWELGVKHVCKAY